MAHARAWPRRALLIALDVGLVVLVYMAALVLRFEGSIPSSYWNKFWPFALIAVVIHVAANASFGLYEGLSWAPRISRVVASGLTAGSALVLLDMFATRGERPFPLSVLIIGVLLSTLGFGLVRSRGVPLPIRRR